MNRPGTPPPAFLRDGLPEEVPGPHQRPEYREMTAPLPVEPGPSRRHCWVTLPDGEAVPGLLVEWRHDVVTGWSAQTVYTVDGLVITAWVAVQDLERA